ncbi:hypothetical protein OCT63_19860 [Vibrio sp. RW]|uniref:hypothetical protein n=1 Tax=Vibrio sp. RW TaxID=2998833 RepID=UPI0022CDB7F3|nr:hypothetical protein [Vibrio sp. RW]MDA0146486.1 hypothetical protein [Vibrio sp. RW]
MNFTVVLLRVLAVAELLSFTFERLGFESLADMFTVLVLVVALLEAFGLIDKLLTIHKRHSILIRSLTYVFLLLAAVAVAS